VGVSVSSSSIIRSGGGMPPDRNERRAAPGVAVATTKMARPRRLEPSSAGAAERERERSLLLTAIERWSARVNLVARPTFDAYSSLARPSALRETPPDAGSMRSSAS
jgi:hypothetical protein